MFSDWLYNMWEYTGAKYFGIPFWICLSNFVVIRWSSAELWRHIHFFKMAAGSHIGVHVGNVRPPKKCNCRYELGPQILSWSDLWYWRYCDFYNLPFWLKIAYSRTFLEGFGGIFPPTTITHCSNPQNDHSWAETRRLGHKAWKSVNRFDMDTRSRKKGKDRIGQDSQKKSQGGNISHIWEKLPLHRLKPKFAWCVISPM